MARLVALALLLFVLAACRSAEAAGRQRVFLPVGDRLVPPTATATRPAPTVTRTYTPIGGVRVATRAPTRSRTPTPPAAATGTPPASTPSPTRTPTAIPTETPEGTPTPFPTGIAPLADPTDAFDRADAADGLGYAPNGALWQSDGSSWGVCAGEACPLGPAASDNWVRIHSRHADVRASVRVPPRQLDAAGAAGLGLRVSPDWRTHAVYVGLDPRGFVEVWALVAGDWGAGPIEWVATAFNGRASRRLEARLVGASLDVYVDSARVLAGVPVPPPPPGATWVALFADTADGNPARWPRFDDFAAGPAP